jgi:hypothetical protein
MPSGVNIVEQLFGWTGYSRRWNFVSEVAPISLDHWIVRQWSALLLWA